MPLCLLSSIPPFFIFLFLCFHFFLWGKRPFNLGSVLFFFFLVSLFFCFPKVLFISSFCNSFDFFFTFLNFFSFLDTFYYISLDSFVLGALSCLVLFLSPFPTSHFSVSTVLFFCFYLYFYLAYFFSLSVLSHFQLFFIFYSLRFFYCSSVMLFHFLFFS